MNELALFAGAGGGLIASRWLLGHRIVCYVERDPYCVEVIKARIADGYLNDAPIWDDAHTFDGRPWAGCVDIVTAGFPCQPFSIAGRQQAGDDERNGWPATIRIIREIRPSWVFLENVEGLRYSHGYFGVILGDLAESGYDAQWRMLSAAELGAPHRRNRVWIVAHTKGQGPQREGLPRSATQRCSKSRETTNVAHTHSQRSHRPPEERNKTGRERLERRNQWPPEPNVARVAHGVANRVGRIKALGNGQVPRVAAAAWRLLSQPT